MVYWGGQLAWVASSLGNYVIFHTSVTYHLAINRQAIHIWISVPCKEGLKKGLFMFKTQEHSLNPLSHDALIQMWL
jgi:hypothetical protein